MREQKRTLVVLLAVLAVLAAVILLIIPALTGANEDQVEELDNKLYLCSFSKSEVERIAYSNKTGSAVLVCENGIWFVEDSGEEVDQTAAANMVAAVCGLYSTQIAFTGEEHFSDCGLDAPTLTVSAATTDGKSIAIRVGAYNNGLDRWYCTVDGGDTIYLIGSNLCTRYSAPLF